MKLEDINEILLGKVHKIYGQRGLCVSMVTGHWKVNVIWVQYLLDTHTHKITHGTLNDIPHLVNTELKLCKTLVTKICLLKRLENTKLSEFFQTFGEHPLRIHMGFACTI